MRYATMEEAAQCAFGIQSLHDMQKKVIANILAGERQIVLLPTGYGKSMCFLVPALMLTGATLVIYPLLALMADQARRMEKAQIHAVVLKGGQTHAQREAALKDIRAHKAQVVLANPEVLQNEQLVASLRTCGIAHIAIDEAHCVSEWGESFRPAYLGLQSVIAKLAVRRVTAFTATASPAVLSDIHKLLFGEKSRLIADSAWKEADANAVKLIQGNFDRANLRYQVQYAAAKRPALLQLVLELPKPLIVFCSTRGCAEETARLLSAFFSERARLAPAAHGGSPQAQTVRFYHAGLTKQEKAQVEQWFFKSTDGILCATCAYGMGVDKADIRTCIHLDAPSKIEFFIQEAGRAGRSGEEATSVLLWNHADARRASALAGYAQSRTCRRQYLLDYLHGEKTTCSGCDICNARLQKKPPAPQIAADTDFVLAWLQTRRRLYTQEDVIAKLLEALNSRDRKKLGINVWDAKDVLFVLSALKDARKIRMVGMGRKQNAHIDAPIRGERRRSLPPLVLTLRRRHHHLLHSLRRRLRALARVQEQWLPIF